MELTCIGCPVGCRLKATVEQEMVTEVSGNQCKRGEAYARQECIDPQRMITAVILVAGSKVPLSVKTCKPISKKKIKSCMAALSTLKLAAPIAAGAVVLADVCGTGVDIIATKSV